jgi:hypothetical protein
MHTTIEADEVEKRTTYIDVAAAIVESKPRA